MASEKHEAAKVCRILTAQGLAMEERLGKTATGNAPGRSETLYRRLGGYDALAAVVDDFIGRLAADPKLARFFQGSSTDSRRHRRQLLVDQLCEAASGPCYYTGRSMKLSHQGLGITEADWDVMVKHLLESLDEFQVPSREKQELIAIVSGTKADIVEAGGGIVPPSR